MCELRPCDVLWNVYVPRGVLSSKVGRRVGGGGCVIVINGKLEDHKGGVVVGEGVVLG